MGPLRAFLLKQQQGPDGNERLRWINSSQEYRNQYNELLVT
jgi:hypothetical protein